MNDLDEAVAVGKALSHPMRVRILVALSERVLCVCELTDLLQDGQPAISRHLGILKGAGLVTDERNGRWVEYGIVPEPRPPFVEAVLGSLENVNAAPGLSEIRCRARTVDRHKILAPAAAPSDDADGPAEPCVCGGCG